MTLLGMFSAHLVYIIVDRIVETVFFFISMLIVKFYEIDLKITVTTSNTVNKEIQNEYRYY